VSALSDFFLTGVVSYGIPLFALALFLGAAGIPLPSSLLVVAAGAFVRQGFLDPFAAAASGLAAAAAGDSIGFLIGRWGGSPIAIRLGSSPAWMKSKGSFEKNSAAAVFLTRFLVTPAALPVNLMAGIGCRYPRFLAVAAFGQTVWIFLYGGLGYFFGSRWELIGQLLSDIGGFAFGLCVLALGVAVLAGSLKKRRVRGGRAPAQAL